MEYYMSVAEASQKWGISIRQVQRLLAENRIPHAKKYGRAWMIPADTKKPADPRRERKQPDDPLTAKLSAVIASSTIPMPLANPDSILEAMAEESLRLQYEAELAYLRGDFEQTMRCYQKTKADDAARLRACPIAIAAAITLSDYQVYQEIDAYLSAKTDKGGSVAAFAELALATAAVSMLAPQMVPQWLKEGDFSDLQPQAIPNALYLRAKYFSSIGKFEAMLAVAQSALAISAPQQGITTTGIYLPLTCAIACHALEQEDEAKKWLLKTMGLALPHGFITPLAEAVTSFGGLMERCLEEKYPEHYDAVIRQWKRTWKNWITFHNRFTEDNITLILSLREYHIALLVARHVPYAQIAAHYCISVGRLKNIMLEIYGKLGISGRDELTKYLL